MKKTLSAAQLSDIVEKARAFTDEPLQLIELSIDLDTNIDLHLDFDSLPPLLSKPSIPVARTPCPGTKRISIRMPNALTRVFKDEAKRRGTQYQTLMIRVLKETSKSW